MKAYARLWRRPENLLRKLLPQIKPGRCMTLTAALETSCRRIPRSPEIQHGVKLFSDRCFSCQNLRFRHNFATFLVAYFTHIHWALSAFVPNFGVCRTIFIDKLAPCLLQRLLHPPNRPLPATLPCQPRRLHGRYRVCCHFCGLTRQESVLPCFSWSWLRWLRLCFH